MRAKNPFEPEKQAHGANPRTRARATKAKSKCSNRSGGLTRLFEPARVKRGD